MADEKSLTSKRACLKQSTDSAHAEAESRWTRSGRFAGREAYQAWLLRMSEVHTGLGAAAAEASGWAPGPAIEARRARRLARDIGAEPIQPTAAPPRLTQDEAWGVLYALNGSALGASVLLRAGLAADDWPRDYLLEMAAFAKSGELRAFFDHLEHQDFNLTGAITGAGLVFDAIAR